MKIFSTYKNSSQKEAPNSKKIGNGNRPKPMPLKKELKESEIREKFQNHVETSNVAKSQAIAKKQEALGEGFMKEGLIKEEVRPGALLNDPNDSNTKEKLKSIIRSGSFSFNPKEKETLEKILIEN